jgi:hypothetical protein
MTIEEAKELNNGDYVFYNGFKYKVLHIKEHRDAHTNEPYVTVKCSRNNETIWLNNKFVELST